MFKKISLLAVFACISLSNQQLTKLNEKYYVSDIPLEFVQAYEVCKRSGLIFATEQNQAETVAINALLTAANKTTQDHWLGGVNQTRGELHGAWVWLDLNKEISDYSRWITTEPSGTNYNCLYRSISGLWKAEPCSWVTYFLCQEP